MHFGNLCLMVANISYRYSCKADSWLIKQLSVTAFLAVLVPPSHFALTFTLLLQLWLPIYTDFCWEKSHFRNCCWEHSFQDFEHQCQDGSIPLDRKKKKAFTDFHKTCEPAPMLHFAFCFEEMLNCALVSVFSFLQLRAVLKSVYSWHAHTCWFLFKVKHAVWVLREASGFSICEKTGLPCLSEQTDWSWWCMLTTHQCWILLGLELFMVVNLSEIMQNLNNHKYHK